MLSYLMSYPPSLTKKEKKKKRKAMPRVLELGIMSFMYANVVQVVKKERKKEKRVVYLAAVPTPSNGFSLSSGSGVKLGGR